MSFSRPTEPPIQVETVELRLRRHGRALTLPVLALVAIAVAAGFWVGALPEAWMNLAAAAGAVILALALGIGPVLGWLTRRIVVTNRRVIVRRGLFVQHRSEIPLQRVREVRSRRTLVQRLFGSGDIELLGGVEGATVLRDVPGFQTVTDALQQLVEQHFSQSESFFTSTAGVPGSAASTGGFGAMQGRSAAQAYGAPQGYGVAAGLGPDDTVTIPR